MKQPEKLKALQDKYLKELNILAGLPEDMKYSQYRWQSGVNTKAADAMRWLAEEYKREAFKVIYEAYVNKEISAPHMKTAMDWPYDVLEKYYFITK